MIRKPSDITEIENGLASLIGRDIPIIPVRYTKGFEYQQKEGQSVQGLVKSGGWYKSKFSTLCDDLNNLFTYLKK
ncbi:MAG: hypothetical protein JKY08_07500 [Flavobacteriaceae bacterium]|nr:hypothetical protein [Flavobacteriaceae bacterium]